MNTRTGVVEIGKTEVFYLIQRYNPKRAGVQDLSVAVHFDAYGVKLDSNCDGVMRVLVRVHENPTLVGKAFAATMMALADERSVDDVKLRMVFEEYFTGRE